EPHSIPKSWCWATTTGTLTYASRPRRCATRLSGNALATSCAGERVTPGSVSRERPAGSGSLMPSRTCTLLTLWTARTSCSRRSQSNTARYVDSSPESFASASRSGWVSAARSPLFATARTTTWLNSPAGSTLPASSVLDRTCSCCSLNCRPPYSGRTPLSQEFCETAPARQELQSGHRRRNRKIRPSVLVGRLTVRRSSAPDQFDRARGHGARRSAVCSAGRDVDVVHTAPPRSLCLPGRAGQDPERGGL